MLKRLHFSALAQFMRNDIWRILSEIRLKSLHSFIGMWMISRLLAVEATVPCTVRLLPFFHSVKRFLKQKEQRVERTPRSQRCRPCVVSTNNLSERLQLQSCCLEGPDQDLQHSLNGETEELSHFTEKQTLTDITCAGLNTGPTTLMWPDASVTLLLNGISGYCCRKTWQLPHYDELKVSSERETSQLPPFISVFTTSTETKEKRWKMCVYLWPVQEEAGQSGFVASEVE